MKLQALKLKGFDEIAVFLLSLCFFVLFLFGKKGIIADFALVGFVVAAVYSLLNIEIFLVFVVYAGAIKSTYLNILPKFVDMTVFFLFLFLAGLILHLIFNKRKIPDIYLFDIVVLFMVFAAFIGFLNTPSKTFLYGLEKLLRFLFLSLPFFYISRMFEDRDLKKIVLFFGLFGGIFSLAVFLYYEDFVVMIHSGVNYLPVAKMAGISLIFNLYLFINEKGLIKKLLFLLLTVFSLLMLFKANSRGAILFSFGVLLIYSWFILKDKKIYFIVLAVTIIVSAIVVFTISPDSFRRFFLLFGRHKGFSVSTRLTMYKLSLKLIQKFWFTGIGLGGFAKYHYLKYPHNILFEFFVECGLLGFLSISLFLGYLFYCSYYLIRVFRLEGEYTPFILSFIFVSLFHMTSFSIMDLRWLFVFAGFVFIFYQRAEGRVEKGKKKEQLKV